MIIWGSRGKQQVIAQGQFFCPKCCKTQSYQHKRLSRNSTLFFIPITKTRNLGEIVECQVCKNVYKPSVLEPGSQSMFKIVATTRSSMMHDISLDEIRTRLIGSGVDDETIDKIIMMAKIR